MNDTRCCETCRHYLGGWSCRINLEAECGKGYFEAWEPKEKAADVSAKEEAVARMANGMREFFTGFCDYVRLALEDLAKGICNMDMGQLIKALEPYKDDLRWTARGPIRRVQLRRARKMMGG